MYGKNEISKPFEQSDKLLVHSIWPTIQGEGPDIGRVSVFIRLAKCNLACTFCDTDFEEGIWFSHNELIGAIETLADQCKARLVVITGGEPLLQNLAPLIIGCNKKGLAVAIETAGTVFQYQLSNLFTGGYQRWKGNIIVCSPKTPKINEEIIPFIGAYKYIIKAGETSNDDGLPIYSTQIPGKAALIHRPRPGIMVYVQPMDEGEEEKNRANLSAATEICMKYGYRLSFQLHKLIGMP